MEARIAEVIGEDSAYTVADKLTRRGHPISAPAVYKWLKGGGIDDPALDALCAEYGVSRGWVRYGEGTRKALSASDSVAAELMQELPVEVKQMTLDFMEYQVHRSATVLGTGEQLARYLTMIDKLKRDMRNKRGH